MIKRIELIRRIQGLIEYSEEHADEILWTKETGYSDNYWLRFRHNGVDKVLYLQGEEYCANVDYSLFLYDGLNDADVPVGEKKLIHLFDYHDTTLALRWAEEWLLDFLLSNKDNMDF